MDTATYKTSETVLPISTLIDIAEATPNDSWLLVGGLMVQIHAGLAGYSSRSTKDVDMLIDVMSSTGNVGKVVRSLQTMGFEMQEPGFLKSPFHRMTKSDFIVDVLVADHLPTGKQASARVNMWPMMETPGGAQAINRKTSVEIATESRKASILIPSLFGALVLKAAAYRADSRDRHRHLDDAALLASLITDHSSILKDMHGSDKKRIRSIAEALHDRNDSSWLLLPEDMRKKGQDTLVILSR